MYIIIRSLISIDPLLSLESSLFYFRFGLFSLSVWYLIENYVNLGFPKKSWVDMFLTNVPISTAEFYYKRSIPIKNWVKTYQTGISLEQISSLESKHNLDISILYKYFNEIIIYGFDNVQTDLLEIKFNLIFERFFLYDNVVILKSLEFL